MPRREKIKCTKCRNWWMTLGYQIHESSSPTNLDIGPMVHICIMCGNQMGVATEAEIKKIGGNINATKT